MAGQTLRSSYIEEVYLIENNDAQIPYQIKILDSRLNYQNLGIGGQRTDEILARELKDAVRPMPVFAVINGGINDLVAGKTNTEILASIVGIVDLFVKYNIYPIYTQITPYTGFATEKMQQRDALKQLVINAIGSKALVVDLDDVLGQFRVGGDSGNMWDQIPSVVSVGAHFNLAGDIAIANKVYNAMINAGLKIPDFSKLELFNRGNTVIHNPTSRSSSYFSMQNPFRWHISELLNYSVYSTFFNPEYADRMFSKVDSDHLVEILNYKTTKINSDLTKVKKYCNVV